MTEEAMSEEKTKIMFVMRRPPHGAIYSYEGLEVVLIAAAYEQDISILFTGDGVFALVKTQDTSELGIKGFVKTYRSLADYEVEKVYVDEQSLKERGLTQDDLIIGTELKNADEVHSLMEEQHVLLPF